MCCFFSFKKGLQKLRKMYWNKNTSVIREKISRLKDIKTFRQQENITLIVTIQCHSFIKIKTQEGVIQQQDHKTLTSNNY